MQPDLQVTDLRLQFVPGDGRVPLEPLVRSLLVELSPSGFAKMVSVAVEQAAHRAPVEIQLGDARLTNGGAEIAARVKRGIFKADLTARLAISAPDGRAVRVRIADVQAPAWVPVQMVLERALAIATVQPGIAAVPGDDRALDLDPAALLAGRGIPLRLAHPGTWRADPRAESLTVAFAAEP